MAKLVATTFCQTLENPTTLCCQIDRKGLVTISLYRDSRVPGATTYFLAEDVDHKIMGLKACNFIIIGEKNDHENVTFHPIRLIHHGKRRLAFRVNFSGQTTRVLRAALVNQLIWLRSKRRTYLRQAA
ncbi:MAG: hypothetical protein WC528_02650 [Patescibacteria group bacterium]